MTLHETPEGQKRYNLPLWNPKARQWPSCSPEVFSRRIFYELRYLGGITK